METTICIKKSTYFILVDNSNSFCYVVNTLSIHCVISILCERYITDILISKNYCASTELKFLASYVYWKILLKIAIARLKSFTAKPLGMPFKSLQIIVGK